MAKTHATAMLRQHAHTAERYAQFNVHIMKQLPSLILLFLFFICSCKSPNSKRSPESIQNDSLKVLSEKIINDSVIVLDQDSYFLIDSTEVKRTIYVDYRRVTDTKKELLSIEAAYKARKQNSGQSLSYKPKNSQAVVNSFDKIKGIFVEISKLNGNNILFSQGNEIEYSLVYISDTIISYNSQESWYSHYFKSIIENDKLITLQIYNDSTKFIETSIKIIDNKNGVQAWEIKYPTWNDSLIITYKLVAPLEYAITLPYLYISNPQGLDCFYNKIDTLDWGKVFNN
jgi:hypothetical protein